MLDIIEIIAWLVAIVGFFGVIFYQPEPKESDKENEK